MWSYSEDSLGETSLRPEEEEANADQPNGDHEAQPTAGTSASQQIAQQHFQKKTHKQINRAYKPANRTRPVQIIDEPSVQVVANEVRFVPERSFII